MDSEQLPTIRRTQRVYGAIVYWITIVACIFCMIGPVISVASPERNNLNPYKLFSAIFEGKDAQTIWQEAGEGFPGGHFYLTHLTFGDGFTQLGLALGCSVALWALIATAFCFIVEKAYFYVILSLWVAFLVFCSMTGIVGGLH